MTIKFIQKNQLSDSRPICKLYNNRGVGYQCATRCQCEWRYALYRVPCCLVPYLWRTCLSTLHINESECTVVLAKWREYSFTWRRGEDARKTRSYRRRLAAKLSRVGRRWQIEQQQRQRQQRGGRADPASIIQHSSRPRCAITQLAHCNNRSLSRQRRLRCEVWTDVALTSSTPFHVPANATAAAADTA